MIPAVVWYVGRGFRGEKSLDNPAYRTLIASSCDASMTNIQINGGIPGHLFHGLVEWANGRFRKGLRWTLKP